MSALIALLIPFCVMIAIAAIILAVSERYSPDPLVTTIVRWVVFLVVMFAIVKHLFPLLGLH